MKRKYFILVLLFALGKIILSQTQILKLEDAIAFTLKNNYDILAANEELLKSKNINTLGNAGILPTVGFSASGNLANNATKQNFATGLVVDKKNVKSNSINSSLFFTWTLFDGLHMFYVKERLNQEEFVQGLEVKRQVEISLFELMKNYFTICKQQQLLIALNENKKLANLIYEVANKKEQSGLVASPDVLRAKLNQNEVSSSLIKENIILQQLKLDLLTKMNEVSLKDFTVQDSLLFESSAELEKNYSSENNTDILSLKKNQEILNSIRKESQSFYFPRLNFNSSYVFSRNENAAGFALLNQNLGLNNGLSLTWNFFDGGKNRVATKNAQIDLYIAKMRVEQLQRKVDAELNFYRNALQEKKIQIDLERQNQVLAEELLKIILERYEQGLCTIVEVNISRQDLLSANLRQIEELYNFKLLELESKRRTGKLIR